MEVCWNAHPHTEGFQQCFYNVYIPQVYRGAGVSTGRLLFKDMATHILSTPMFAFFEDLQWITEPPLALPEGAISFQEIRKI